VTPHVRVLGVAQDAGVPHPGCTCPRCERHRDAPLLPASLALVAGGRCWLVDATPALPAQLRMLPSFPAGVLLTHVHMGHVAGLLHLGPEACDVRDFPVYATASVHAFLENNAPWSRLGLRHVEVRDGDAFELEGIAVRPFRVKHRGPFSDTVGFRFTGPGRTLLYCPDADRFDDLPALLDGCDVALLDGTFFSRDELPRQADVPHPPIEETWAALPPAARAKVRFLHFNHTNPVLDPGGPDVPRAAQGEILGL